MKHILSYVSTANIYPHSLEIHELFRQTEHTNNDLGISGMLVYSDGHFFQILEGDKEDVLNVYSKIIKDNRHYDIIKILDAPCSHRFFYRFNIPYKAINEDNSHKELNLFLQWKKITNPKHYKSFYYVLKNFLRAPSLLPI